MEKINLKKEGIKILAGVIYVVVLLVGISYFNLNTIQIYVVLLAGSVILLISSNRFKLKTLLIQAVTLASILLLMRWLGGWAGGFVSTFVLCAIILIGRRKKFMRTKHQLEALIWGKPLKDYVKEGERPPKVKIEL